MPFDNWVACDSITGNLLYVISTKLEPVSNLLSDTKIFKDVSKDFVVADFTGDFSEEMKAFANILSQEVTANSVMQTINHPEYRLVCVG